MMDHLLLKADARALPLARGSIDCVVTSPPYWMQRDYHHTSQIGLEPTEGAFVSQLSGIFGRIKPLLRPGATVFINIGDTYNAYNGNRGKGSSFAARYDGSHPELPMGHGLTSRAVRNKSLVGIPWRFALAMTEAGWILRAQIIWDKGPGMPQRVKDRPYRSHEEVFLFTLDERYRWFGAPMGSVWRIPTSPQSGAHPAKMPTSLAARCIKAGCPVGGIVLDPFSGSSTTGVAALATGRRYIGCDLNWDYLSRSRRRITRPHARTIRDSGHVMPLFPNG